MLTRPLAGIGPADLPQVGGKALGLGDLIRADLPVPAGFVVTSDARRLAAVARDAPVPPAVADAISAAYRALGEGPVAVRSSATAEDLPGASFAGQQDSFLDVRGSDAVIDAVRRCWASLWSERAIAYRAAHQVDERGLGIAVVVQRMVDARSAGVLFTADPVTGRRGTCVIEAVRGLGDRLVSGAENPDRFRFDPATGAVLERQGDVLADAQIATLARLGARAEAQRGAPQDVEWAIDAAGAPWLVQSRDITTLYPLPAGASAEDPRVYFSINVAQGVLGPFTPLGAQTFQLIGSSLARRIGAPVADPVAGPPALVEAGLRLFADVTGALRNPVGRELAHRALSVMEARSAAVLTLVGADPRLRARGSRPLAAFGLLRRVLRTGAPEVALRVFRHPHTVPGRILAEVDAVLREHAAAGAAATTAAARVDAYERLFLDLPGRVFPRLVALVIPGMLAYVAAGRILGRRSTPAELQTVLRGLARNPTTEMDLALGELADGVRSDPAARDTLARAEIPAALRVPLAAFLARFGHRAVAEIDIGIPRWSEDPAQILGAVANYLRLDDPERAPAAQFARAAREADAMIATLLSRVHGPRRALARLLLSRVRALAGLREMPKFQLVRALALGRSLIAPVGAELAAAGRIDRPDEVWMLTLPELRRAVAGEDLRALAADRRATHSREQRRRLVPRVLLSDGTMPETLLPAAAAGALVGSAASPGIATGSARVIRVPAGARLEPGEVLVAPTTDPGWTPLFLTAGALVMEMGGMMSHGAVVAREYGIPAVVGVAHATSRIVTGDVVVVDGAAGTIVVERAAR